MSSTKPTESIDLTLYERQGWAQGHRVIAGLDEVGRGPLAGPVVAACVVLPSDFSWEGIRDSKKLSERQRERAAERIRAEAIAFGIGQADAQRVDQINILRATHEAMRLALKALPKECEPTLALVDGLPIPQLPCSHQRAIVKGDNLSVSIAAASIIAKVCRDHLMIAYSEQYPEYGFAGHKGYGSAAHIEALQKHGPCPIHRRSFAPVSALCLDI